jgi:hypothetical protein
VIVVVTLYSPVLLQVPPVDTVTIIGALAAVITTLSSAIGAMAVYIVRIQADRLKATEAECKAWQAHAQSNGKIADETLSVTRAVGVTLDKINEKIDRMERARGGGRG